jgi:hypothetical protein
MSLLVRDLLLNIISVAAILAGGISAAQAQEREEGLTLTGSMRLRYEAIQGPARAGFNESDDLVNLRTDILAEYRTRDVRIGVNCSTAFSMQRR